ncbi:TorF family putative porin [Winogradskyella thalassocola]|uniref:Uncharacterized protein n=1 Tax=Winogradskyella thalassocola TaxID=262004 RepID=A0A1G8L8Q9_9FLAO|nr:TorF family putative porin [Winogradskyella thalassocola]SDI52002.1 protein of unknown function (Gcw_chp) [Winogradskyella thalassocola]
MKHSSYNSILKIALILFCNLVMSQSDEVIENIEKVNDSSYISLDLNYISDAVFMGRKDSISSPYLCSSITYHHKSGFYATGSVSYLTRADEGRIDLFVLTGGFDFTLKKLDGDISVTKYIFNEDSYNVISQVEADITAQLIYDFNVVNLGIATSVYLNSDSNSDIFLSSEISHDFVSRNEKFQISPTVGVYLGSQNFYEQYYINNRFGNGRGQQGGQGGQTIINMIQATDIEFEESEKFGLMAIEFSLPMWYVNEPWVFSVLPTYVLPQNPATLTVDDVVFEEDLENTFYWMVGVAHRF